MVQKLCRANLQRACIINESLGIKRGLIPIVKCRKPDSIECNRSTVAQVKVTSVILLNLTGKISKAIACCYQELVRRKLATPLLSMDSCVEEKLRLRNLGEAYQFLPCLNLAIAVASYAQRQDCQLTTKQSSQCHAPADIGQHHISGTNLAFTLVKICFCQCIVKINELCCSLLWRTGLAWTWECRILR